MRSSLALTRSRPSRRAFAVLTSVLLVLSALVVVQTGVAHAAGTPDVVGGQSAPGQVLIGSDIPVEVTVDNPDSVPGYNALVRAVLPAGVTYVPGSVRPADAGAPQVLVDRPTVGETTLVWKNVADVQPDGTLTLGFDVRPDVDALPVGSVVDIATAGYLQSDPRAVPTTNAAGVPTGYTGRTATSTTSTRVAAFEVELHEPSPEHELVRGVHDETTTYRVTVRNNDVNASDDIELSVLLPAGLEFLGCGGVDNTPGGTPEYDGAPGLDVVPAPTGPGTCDTPDSVETVVDPPGYPAGVYTRVTWTVGDLAPGAEHEIKYRAGIPLNANTATFPGGEPSAASGEQGANLDNNTGASTRETDTEQGLTTHAVATGDYIGPFAPGMTNPQTADTELTVTSEDLAIVKTGDTDAFEQGGVVEWTLRVRTGEYRGATNLVVTDTLPNGFCPLDDVNHSTGDLPECDPVLGVGPSHPYTSVTQLPGGGFELVIDLDDLGTSDEVVITLPTRARTGYHGGASNSQPTVGGDSFTNHVSITGTSTPTDADDAPAVTVHDESGSSIDAAGPEIDKKVSERPSSGVIDCATADYVDTPDEASRPIYTNDDRVCFLLRVDFPSVANTRNAVVTDFLPEGAVYVPGSLTVTTDNTVPAGQVDVDASTAGVVEIELGETRAGGRFVAPGAVFEATLAVDLTGPAPETAADRIRGNLMKLRAINTDGQAFSLRDQVDYVQDGPDLSVLKGVAGVDAAPAVPTVVNAPDTDDVEVRQDDNVLFRIDITNAGPIAAEALRVVDTLPAGIACIDVSAISDGGTCASGVITWELPASDVVAAGATRAPLTYVVNVPDLTPAGHVFVNDVEIDEYDVRTTLDTTTTYESGATDDSSVRLPGATLEKTRSTGYTGTGNTNAQATIGEMIDYTVTVTIPRGTTVHHGLLTDTLPAGVTVQGTPAPAATLNGAALPGDWVFTTTATGFTVDLPDAYTNPSTSSGADTLVVTMRVKVDDVAGNERGVNLTNRSRFDSKSATGTDLEPLTSNASTRVVEPRVTIDKTSDAAGEPVGPGQEIEYTVTPGAADGQYFSAAYDVVVVDTLPTGVTYVPGSASDGGVYADATRTITWVVPTIAPGSTAPRTYSVTVDSPITSAATFTNTVTATTTSLPGTVPGERTTGTDYSATTNHTLQVGVPPVTKSVDEPTRTVGEIAEYTVTATIPAGIVVNDATLIDVVPEGLQPVGTPTVTCTPDSAPDEVCSTHGFAATQLPTVVNGDGTTTLGWFLGDLGGAPEERTITVTYQARLLDVPAVAAGETLTNEVRLYWNLTNGPDPTTIPGDPTDEFDQTTPPTTADVTVVEPELTISKSIDDDTLEPGDTTTFTLVVTNAATDSSPAYDYVVTDVLPAGIELVGTPSDGGTYDSATRTLRWELDGPLAVGDSETLTFDVRLAASGTLSDGQVITNTAVVDEWRGLPDDPDEHGREYGPSEPDDADVTARFPHVVVSKTTAAGTEQGTATIGQPFGWQVVVQNTGDGTAYEVVLSDELPEDWTYDAGSAQVTLPSGGTTQVEPTVVGGLLTWDVGTLAPGESATVVLTATPGEDVVDGTGVGPANPHVNTASVVAEDATGETGNGDGPYNGPPDDASAIIDSTDLSITKSHSGDFTAGTQGTYTLTVHNAGPSVATGTITVVDTLPTDLSYVSHGGAGWSCTAVGQVVTCTSEADIAVDADATPLTLTVAVAASLRDGEVVNGAEVSTTTYDPDPSNNDDEDPTDVRTSVDLGVVKAVTGDVVAGQTVTWTLDVTNHGPSDSDGPIVVTDELPDGVTYTSASGTGWSCEEDGGTVECTRTAALTAFSSAAQIVLVGELDPDATGDLLNTAVVDGPHPDPNDDNDEDEAESEIRTSADLDISKSHVDEFVPGELGTYTITVTNHGPSVARGDIVVTDTLPAGLTYDSYVGADWSCAAVGQAVTCTHADDLGVDDVTSFDLVVDVASSVTGAIENTAEVSSPTDDPDEENNTDDDSTDSDVQADLGIVKSHPAGEVVAGEDVTFTLEVTNHGPSDSDGPIEVRDPLPAGMTYVSAEGVVAADGWDCDLDSGDVVCTLPGGLDDGDSSSIEVTVTVDSDVLDGTLNNVASVDGPDDDPNPQNDSSTDGVTVVTRADLELDKNAVDAVVVAGTQTSFTLDVTNNGPSDAAGPIVVTDTLPAGTAYADFTGAGWSCDATGQVVTCTHAAGLGADDSAARLTVTVDVLSGTPAGALTNDADLDGPTTDPVPGNNDDDDTFEVVTSADLTVEKSHGDGPHHAGEVVEWTLQVSNLGPSDAADATVVDTLPTGFTFVDVAAPSAWTCDAEGQEVTCDLPQPVVADTDAPTLVIRVLADAALPAGTYTNAVVVSSSTTDPVPGNNDDEDGLPLTTSADVAIVKTLVSDVVIGSQATYRLDVENLGPSQAAADVVVTDVLPAGLRFVSADGEGWDCVEADGTVTCTLDGDLPVGEAEPITLVVDVRAPAYPSVTNAASVTTGTDDPNPENDESTVTTPVDPRADLEITKTHVGEFVVGETGTYRLRVVNHGPTEDPGPVVVTDTLPSGLTYVGADGAGWDCAAVGQQVTCELADGLAVDAESTVTLTVDVLASAAPGVVNTASVTGAGVDPEPGNDTSTDETPVTPVADLEIVKTLRSAAVSDGEATYRLLVRNNGPNASVGTIVVSDPLPKGLTFVSASGDGWDCGARGALVTCSWDGTLAVGELTPPITLVTAVDAAAGSEIRNVASVDGPLLDPVDDNDSAGVVAKVVEDPDGVLAETGRALLAVGLFGLLVLLVGVAMRSTRRPRTLA